MENLKKYMDKNGIEYRPARFGGGNYFYNVQQNSFDGYTILFPWRDTTAEKKMVKWCNRHGYYIQKIRYFYGYVYYDVSDKRLMEMALVYREYANKSRNECEQIMQKWHTGELEKPENENNALKEVMDRYGEECIKALEQYAKSNAA